MTGKLPSFFKEIIGAMLNLCLTVCKTPFHWTAIRLRSWRSRIFSKIIPNGRGSVGSNAIWGFDSQKFLQF